jgi:hypothetical protein
MSGFKGRNSLGSFRVPREDPLGQGSREGIPLLEPKVHPEQRKKDEGLNSCHPQLHDKRPLKQKAL